MITMRKSIHGFPFLPYMGMGLRRSSAINIVMTLLSSIMCIFTPLFRGTNGPGGWAIREAEGNPCRTEYVWLVDVDLKVNTLSKSKDKGV